MSDRRQATLHSFVVTGSEPDGGLTMVVDLGNLLTQRYLCVEFTPEQIRSLIQSLQEFSNRKSN